MTILLLYQLKVTTSVMCLEGCQINFVKCDAVWLTC